MVTEVGLAKETLNLGRFFCEKTTLQCSHTTCMLRLQSTFFAKNHLKLERFSSSDCGVTVTNNGLSGRVV